MAIVDWVENGKAPDRVVARTSSGPPLSRPLCPYPTVARYKGGDPADARASSARLERGTPRRVGGFPSMPDARPVTGRRTA